MFTPLHELIPKVANKFQVNRQLTASHVCEKYRKIAPSILGEKLNEFVFPRFYRQKILYLKVSDTLVSQEVFLKKQEIIKRMNEEFGQEIITEIHLSLSSLTTNY